MKDEVVRLYLHLYRLTEFRDSIVVSISACHADDPGSIPGRGDICHARCVERLCVLSQFFLNVEELCALCYELLQWPCGPMDKASVYGTGDCRFESYQGQLLLLGIFLLFRSRAAKKKS